MKKLLTRLVLPVLLVVSPACDCGRNPGVTSSVAGLGVVWTDGEGKLQVNRDASYDFGPAFMGERVPQKLVIRNLGAGPLTLVGIERLDGDPVTVGEGVADDAAFEIRWTAGQSVDALDEAQLDMFFTPPQAKDPTVTSVPHRVKLLLRTSGAPEDESTATLILSGVANAGACAVPARIDFGKVLVGSTASATHTFNNRTPLASTATVGALYGPDASSFRFASGAPGDFLVEEGKAVSVRFEFLPKELRTYEARVKMRAASPCPEGEVTLVGEAVDELLLWNPTSLDFGYTPPNTSAPKTVMFQNLGSTPLTLTQVGTTLPSDFAVQAAPGTDPSTFTLAPNSITPMTVVCRPSVLGPRKAQLSFRTPLPKQPQGAIALSCFGGGPNISVSPRPEVSFGKVAFFPNANPAPSVSRRVTVLNIGTKPPNGDVNGNLKLGSIGPNGPGQLPYVSLLPLNANTAPGEFSLSLGATYNPSTGLEATAGKNWVDLTVTLIPRSLGSKSAELTLYSNDPDEPVIKLRLSADAQTLPPCNLSVTPAQLNFGLVTPPESVELPVTVTNLGVTPQDICTLSGIDLAPGSALAYSLSGGPVASKELGAGESLTLAVKVTPTGVVPQSVTNLNGYLQFNVNHPTTPQQLVKLQAQVGPTCLTIAPSELDFGTVKPGCGSPARNFTVYNTCTQTVKLTQVSMQAAAGQPARGPNCPGNQPCPEFGLVSTPTLPQGGLSVNPGYNPINFQVRYRPIDFGKDYGAIALSGIQNGQNVTYLVSVSGFGDTTGLQTDSFRQDLKPKADILLTIDNSGSMDDEQVSLSNNFASFIAYANAANVDYHLAVTTTDDESQASYFNGTKVSDPGEQGRIVGDANNPKILTPNTPNVSDKFKAKVRLGTNGSGDERGLSTSMKALTPPLITNENDGFLRPDANLAVVVVTDAYDSSPQPVSYYYNRLMNVKGFNRANMFTFNVIGPFDSRPPSNCYYDGGSDDGRWASIVSSTSGFKEEICSPNWALKMQDLGKTAFGFRTTFYLNAVPDLTGGKALSVKIDGSAVPATDFSYDSAANAVVFATTRTPGPGQQLEVAYQTACF